MKATCYGFTPVDYTSRKTGKPVKGINFHVLSTDRNTTGFRADTIYIPENWGIVPPMNLPCDVEIIYNRYGNVDDFRFIP